MAAPPFMEVHAHPGQSVSLVCVPPSGSSDHQLYLLDGAAVPLFSITWNSSTVDVQDADGQLGNE